MGKNIIDLSGGQINDPSSGKEFSLPFLPATSSSPSQTLVAHALLLLELQRYKDIVRCGVAMIVSEIPGHLQKQLTETLIVQFAPSLFQQLGAPLAPSL